MEVRRQAEIELARVDFFVCMGHKVEELFARCAVTRRCGHDLACVECCGILTRVMGTFADSSFAIFGCIGFDFSNMLCLCLGPIGVRDLVTEENFGTVDFATMDKRVCDVVCA